METTFRETVDPIALLGARCPQASPREHAGHPSAAHTWAPRVGPLAPPPAAQGGCMATTSGRDDCPRALAARASERSRISRELHDDLGQRLLALRLDVELAGRVTPEGNAPLRRDLARVLAAVDGSIDAVRRIAADLRPAALEGIGLAEALQRLGRQWADRCGLQVEWLAGFPEELHNDLSSELSWALYRMAQESFGNIARHAQARVVRLRLVRQAGEIVFTVDDDGCGASPREGTPGERCGLGLQGLAERFALLGGRFRMVKGELGGCRVEARVPWPVAHPAGPLRFEKQPAQNRSTH